MPKILREILSLGKLAKLKNHKNSQDRRDLFQFDKNKFLEKNLPKIEKVKGGKNSNENQIKKNFRW